MINLKKIPFIIVIITILGIFTRCEIDDICTEKVLTPRLVVKFYDKDDHDDMESLSKLSVWAVGKDSLVKNEKKDSIFLPLDSNASVTKYCLSNTGVIDTLTVFYDKEIVFVSRSCGYKTLFSLSENIPITKHWVAGLELAENPQKVQNETKAHVKLYH